MMWSDCATDSFATLRNHVENSTLTAMTQTLGDMLCKFTSMFKDKIEVASTDEVKAMYEERRMSFSVIALQKETFSIKICIGSHRQKFSKRLDETVHLVHRSLIIEICIPEKCILVMDVNLVQNP